MDLFLEGILARLQTEFDPESLGHQAAALVANALVRLLVDERAMQVGEGHDPD